MLRMILTLSCALIALLLTACKTEMLADSSSVDPRDFTLTAGETVLVNNMNFQFERVGNDSRCPKGTQCIAAGSAEVIVNYTLENKPIQKTLLLSPGQKHPVFSVGATRFTLGFLKPYPSINIRINPQQYQAHFIVTKDTGLTQATVIDVRTPEEFASSHYSDATNIPYDEIPDQIQQLNLNKDDQIVVYCRSGNRAGKAKVSLEKLGFTNVINAVDETVAEQLLQ